jgi:hypothetical protein
MADTNSISADLNIPRDSSDPAHPVAPATHIFILSILFSILENVFRLD